MDDPVFGEEPWISDGTASGTHLLKDLRLGPDDSAPVWITPAGGTTYLVATGDRPGELWKTDGTKAGTVKVATPGGVDNPLAPGLFLGPILLTRVGGLLFYAIADDLFDYGVFGDELGRSDGTPQGTGLARDICPGPCSSRPNALVAGKGALYFTAREPEHGDELWTSDGTARGTLLLADVQPGPRGSNPYALTVSGSHLFFTAERDDRPRTVGSRPFRTLTFRDGAPSARSCEPRVAPYRRSVIRVRVTSTSDRTCPSTRGGDD